MSAGVCAAGDPATAEVGARLLRAGGNAVDAAVGATFATFVTEPGRVHLGGSGVGHVFDAATASATAYDFFSATPGLGGTRPERLDFRAVEIDFGDAQQWFHVGRASVAVPGNVFGLAAMAEAHGRLPWGELLAPAIELASRGVELNEAQADTVAILEEIYTLEPRIAAVFAPGGRRIGAGDRYFVPGLAELLRAIATDGAAALRGGVIADEILDDQRAHGGLLTARDLADYRAVAMTPVCVRYRGCDVLVPPPPSTGGLLIAVGLSVLRAFDVAALGAGTAEHYALLAETMAAMDRARGEWAAARRAAPDVATAVERLLAGDACAARVDAVRAGALRARGDGPRPVRGPGETTHVSALDGDGTAASITNSSGIASGFLLPCGLILNSILGEADLHPQGFHVDPPGERIETMMAPTVVRRDGAVELALGSGGSSRIRTAMLQVISNVLDFGLDPDAAVAAARVHLEGTRVEVEAGFDAAAVDAFAAQGYSVNRWTRRSAYFGGAHAVGRDADGRLRGAGDDRRGGAVAFA